MSSQPNAATRANPFHHGYEYIRILRMVLITQAHHSALLRYKLHYAQTGLVDADLIHRACLITEETVFVTDGHKIPSDVRVHSDVAGLIRAVVYSVSGEDCNGVRVDIGDVETLEAAYALVRQVSWMQGRQRYWEISSTHITDEGRCFLERELNVKTSSRLFEPFQLPNSSIFGVRLIATPWLDAHQAETLQNAAEKLRQKHRDDGMPESLATLLHLAGEAGVRMLLFCPNGPRLPGLSVYLAE